MNLLAIRNPCSKGRKGRVQGYPPEWHWKSCVEAFSNRITFSAGDPENSNPPPIDNSTFRPKFGTIVLCRDQKDRQF
jgi:hypothetical protein